MLCRRQSSASFAPASYSLMIPTICSSVNRLLRICPPPERRSNRFPSSVALFQGAGSNRPPALGIDTAIRELGLLLASVASARGCHREAWRLRGTVLVETEVGVPDDAARRDRIPVAVILRVDGGGKAVDVRLYLGPAPLARTRTRRT